MATPEVADASSYLDYLKNGFTWLLVVVGWMVVSDQQDDREIRKEVASRCGEFRKLIGEIEKIALEHHTSSFDEERTRKLARLFARAGYEASSLKQLGCTPRRWIESVADFKVACMLKNFDKSTYHQLAASDAILSQIAETSDELDRAVSNAAIQRSTTPKTLWASLKAVASRRLF